MGDVGVVGDEGIAVGVRTESLHRKRNRHGLVGDALLHFFEEVDFEGFADVVAGEVFDGGLGDELIMARLPRCIWGEFPAAFVVGEGDVAGDVVAFGVGDPEHALGEGVVEGFGELHGQGVRRGGFRRGEFPIFGGEGGAIWGAHFEGLFER